MTDVVDLIPEQNSGSDKDKKKKGPPPEMLWRRHCIAMLNGPGNAGFGYERLSDGKVLLYRKEMHRWVPVRDLDECKEMTTHFLTSRHPELYTQRAVEQCARAMYSFIPNDCLKLRRDKKRVLISAENCILEAMPDGRFKFHNPNHAGFSSEFRNTIVRSHVDFSIDMSQVKDGYYTPRQELPGGLLGKLLKDFFPDKQTHDAFQEFVGDTLHPTQRKAFPVLIGTPDSGKSQVLSLIKKLHKDSIFADLSDIENFELEPWIGKSVVIVDELGDSITERIFKRVVGGAGTPIRRKGMSTVSVEPTWKLIGGANKLFRIDEKTGAVETRIYPFVVPTYNGPLIDALAEKISEGYIDDAGKSVRSQLPEFFDWCLVGLARVCKRGRTLRHDELPQESKAFKETIKKAANPVIEWLDHVEAIATEPMPQPYDSDEEMERKKALEGLGELMPKELVYRAFCEWAKRQGKKNAANLSLDRWTKEFFLPAADARFGSGWNRKERRPWAVIDGKRVRAWSWPIAFMNERPEEAAVSRTEVIDSFNREDAYDAKNLPPHIIERLRIREENRKKSDEEKMAKLGLVKHMDPYWGETWIRPEDKQE